MKGELGSPISTNRRVGIRMLSKLVAAFAEVAHLRRRAGLRRGGQEIPLVLG
jgi:hypothetical protein